MKNYTVSITFVVDDTYTFCIINLTSRKTNESPAMKNTTTTDYKPTNEATMEARNIEATEIRNRINRIISGCMTRGMSSEATSDEVWEYLRLNSISTGEPQWYFSECGDHYGDYDHIADCADLEYGRILKAAAAAADAAAADAAAADARVKQANKLIELLEAAPIPVKEAA